MALLKAPEQIQDPLKEWKDLSAYFIVRDINFQKDSTKNDWLVGHTCTQLDCYVVVECHVGDQTVAFLRSELTKVAGVTSDPSVNLTHVVENVPLLKTEVGAMRTPRKVKTHSVE